MTSHADRDRAGRPRIATALLRVLPACAAGALFAHLSWFGLRPALAERARLDRVAVDVRARHARLTASEAELRSLAAALDDPVYRERLRRSFHREREAERAAAREAAAAADARRDPTWFGRPGEAEALTLAADLGPARSVRSERPRRSRVR